MMKKENIREYLALSVSLVMIVSGMVMSSLDTVFFSDGMVKIVWYLVAYLPVGVPVIHKAIQEMSEGNVFSEFTLMAIATLGAFFVGEYPEAVGVMLFYFIGELFQDYAVDKAKLNIKSLVDIRPDRAAVVMGDLIEMRQPEEVKVDDIIQVKPGERVPLDGVLLSAPSAFNTAALTGESMPRTIAEGGEVLAGMISSDKMVRVRVTRIYAESALTRIMNMVRDAAERKAPAELFISKFAHIYTPVVILLAVLTVILPFLYSLISSDFIYVFSEWFYRALIFLVISCPCALVVSIPLSYFAGIGLASRHGILFKGGNYMDAILAVRSVVFDKTGTLTKGVFSVSDTIMPDSIGTDAKERLIHIVSAVERTSNHPIAKAIVKYADMVAPSVSVDHVEVTDIPGYGLSATVDGSDVLVGTLRLLHRHHVSYPKTLDVVPETIVACAENGHFIGAFLLSDTLKDDAHEAIGNLRNTHISDIEILSGDKQSLVDMVVQELGVDRGYGDLLPEDKVNHIVNLKDQLQKADSRNSNVIFVGDGINDAPVLAMSDVSIAMGGAGSDVAIETADVVIQDERPSKVAMAIQIAARTRRNVIENVTLALGVKLIVMVLGVLGIATMWEAVFADVGVTILAVFNAMRLIKR
jgi:Zn2+/Cd2+-exporting ATPase